MKLRFSFEKRLVGRHYSKYDIEISKLETDASKVIVSGPQGKVSIRGIYLFISR